jgi:hypothetical protein
MVFLDATRRSLVDRPQRFGGIKCEDNIKLDFGEVVREDVN